MKRYNQLFKEDTKDVGGGAIETLSILNKALKDFEERLHHICEHLKKYNLYLSYINLDSAKGFKHCLIVNPAEKTYTGFEAHCQLNSSMNVEELSKDQIKEVLAFLSSVSGVTKAITDFRTFAPDGILKNRLQINNGFYFTYVFKHN